MHQLLCSGITYSVCVMLAFVFFQLKQVALSRLGFTSVSDNAHSSSSFFFARAYLFLHFSPCQCSLSMSRQMNINKLVGSWLFACNRKKKTFYCAIGLDQHSLFLCPLLALIEFNLNKFSFFSFDIIATSNSTVAIVWNRLRNFLSFVWIKIL